MDCNTLLLQKMDELKTVFESSLGKIDTKISALELRLSKTGKSVCRMQQVQEMQQEQIDALRRKVDELSTSKAVIWQSKDGSRVGVDKDSCYKAFFDLGIEKRQAMLKLRDLGIIKPKEDGRLTCPVRDKARGPIRAIVIFKEVL